MTFEPLLFAAVATIAVLYGWRPGHQTRELLDALAAVVIVAVGVTAPRFCIRLVVLTIPLVPYGFIRGTAQYPGDITAVLAVLFAAAFWLSPTRQRAPMLTTSIDAVVVAVWSLMLISVVYGDQTFSTWEGDSVLWLGPYFFGRLIATSASHRQMVSRCLVVGAVILAPFVWLEAATGSNLFTHLDHGASAAFANSALSLRGGGHRASASFLQPIALAMFLATAILLGVGLAFDAVDQRSRRWWTAATVINLASVALTISRTAWLVLAVASVLALITVPSAHVRRTIAIGLIIAAVALVALARLGPSSISSGIPIIGTKTAQTQQSTDYRGELLQTALSRHLLRPFGSKTNTLANAVDANYTSVDNEYLYITDQFGYGPGIFLALLLPLVIVLSLRRRMPDCLSAMWFASAAGLLAGVWTVAFITQQQVLVWLVLGVCSGFEAGSPQGLLVPLSRRTRAVRHWLVSARV